MFIEVASLTNVKKSKKVGPQLGNFWAFSHCVQIQPVTMGMWNEKVYISPPFRYRTPFLPWSGGRASSVGSGVPLEMGVHDSVITTCVCPMPSDYISLKLAKMVNVMCVLTESEENLS